MLQLAYNHTEENILGLEVRKLPVDWIKEVVKGESLPNISVIWYSLPNGLSFYRITQYPHSLAFFQTPGLKKNIIKEELLQKSLYKNA